MDSKQKQQISALEFNVPAAILSHPVPFNPLTPELNTSAQRCLTRFLLGILLLEPCI
jgi:hypothetical protein